MSELSLELASQWEKHKVDEALFLNSVLEGGATAFFETASIVGPWMFSTKPATNVWGALYTLYSQGVPITYHDVITRLVAPHSPLPDGENAAMRAYLTSLGSHMGTMTHGYHMFYAKQVATNARKRVAYQLTQRALQELEADNDTQETLGRLNDGIAKVFQENEVGALSTAEIHERIKAAQEAGEPEKQYFTGISTIDALLKSKPIVGGNIVIIAGATGHGKTTLALSIAYNNAKKGNKVLIISYEMTVEENYQALAKIPRYDKAVITQKQVDDRIDPLPIYIDDRSPNNLMGVENSIKHQLLKEGVDIVVIDYLGLMDGEGKSTYEKVTAVSQGLKRMAQRLRLPFIVLSQFNRLGQNQKPTLGSLRDSGAIEQDANKVFLIHLPNDEDKSQKSIIVAKNRGGATGEAPVIDNLTCGYFTANTLGYGGF